MLSHYKPLDLVYSDVVGAIAVQTFSGVKYFVTLYDENRVISLVRFIANRSAVKYAIQEMVTEIGKFRRGNVTRSRWENGVEYVSKHFEMWLKR